MEFFEIINLQLFAEGGAGGTGDGGAAVGNTGVTAPDAGEQDLDLRTPRTSRQRERAKRRQARVGQQSGTMASGSDAGSAAPGTQSGSFAAASPHQAADAGGENSPQGDGDGSGEAAQAQQPGDPNGAQAAQAPVDAGPSPQGKPSFEELLQDPEHKKAFDKRVNELFRQRFGDETKRQERDGNVNQLLTTLAQMLGQTVDDPAKLDPAALRQSLLESQTMIDAAAMEAGVSSQQYRADLEMRSENAVMKAQLDQQRAQQQANAQEMQRRQAFMALQQEAEQLKTIYPQLDLGQMMQEPQTIRTIQALQMAGAKDPVRTVYEASHRDEIMGGLAARAAQTGMQKVAASVAANQKRPSENGQRSQGGIMTSMDVRNLSKAQRKDIRERVRRGEKIRF